MKNISSHPSGSAKILVAIDCLNIQALKAELNLKLRKFVQYSLHVGHTFLLRDSENDKWKRYYTAVMKIESSVALIEVRGPAFTK